MNRLISLAAGMLLTLISSPALLAQQSINHAIADAEKASSTQYVVYSEKRHPETHKVYKSSKVLIINGDMAKKVSKAFEKDRPKSVSYELFDQGRGYQVTFNGKSECSQYTLIRQHNGQWVLTVEQSPLPRAGRSTSSLEPVDLDDWVCIPDGATYSITYY